MGTTPQDSSKAGHAQVTPSSTQNMILRQPLPNILCLRSMSGTLPFTIFTTCTLLGARRSSHLGRTHEAFSPGLRQPTRCRREETPSTGYLTPLADADDALWLRSVTARKTNHLEIMPAPGY